MTSLFVILLAVVQPLTAWAGAQESPFVCNLGVLTAEDRARKEEISRSLRGLIAQVRELPDGFEFQFRPEAATLPLLGEWTWSERLCCPFFDFDLRLEREGGPLRLRLTGREGVKQFINATPMLCRNWK